MGGLHFTMNEEELLMERERKVEESYKSYYDSRPELKKASDDCMIYLKTIKFLLRSIEKNHSNSAKNIDKKL